MLLEHVKQSVMKLRKRGDSLAQHNLNPGPVRPKLNPTSRAGSGCILRLHFDLRREAEVRGS
jgi:hypothetical protein